jgi:hypothetical protein
VGKNPDTVHPEILSQAEKLLAGMTSFYREHRLRIVCLLIAAGGGPIRRSVLSWLRRDAWYDCLNTWVFTTSGGGGRGSDASVSLSRQARVALGWPVEPRPLTRGQRLAGVRAALARAKNIATAAEALAYAYPE